MNTLEHFVRRHALAMPQRIALRDAQGEMSYGQLWALVEELASQIRLPHRRAITLTMQPTTRCVATYLAIHHAGCVAVPLPPDMPLRQRQLLEEQLTQGSLPDEVADILFTTGTTGEQKGVMVSHRAIRAEAENLAEAQGYRRDLTFIITGPLNHIGSLSKLYPSFLQGAAVHLLDGLRDLPALLRAIDQSSFPVATFQVPAALNMLMAVAGDDLRKRAPKIDFIETGAAAMAQSDMLRLCQLLPSSRLYNTYASTETGIIATHNFNDGDPVAGCLGRPMRHSSFSITADGRVECRGETLMTGYWQDPELTAQVMSGDGALCTHDLGQIDSEGRLHLMGRDGDIINVGGYKVNPLEVENAAMGLREVKDCLLVAAHHPVLGTQARLLVVPAAGVSPSARQIALALRERLEAHKVPQRIDFVDAIRRTFNGKPDRKAYF